MPAPAVLVPLVGGFIAAMGRMFSTKIGGWVATAAMALGIGLVTNEAIMQPAIQAVQSAAAGVPGTALAWAGVLNLDKYITIVLSAYAAGGIKRAILARRPT